MTDKNKDWYQVVAYYYHDQCKTTGKNMEWYQAITHALLSIAITNHAAVIKLTVYVYLSFRTHIITCIQDVKAYREPV